MIKINIKNKKNKKLSKILYKSQLSLFKYKMKTKKNN